MGGVLSSAFAHFLSDKPLCLAALLSLAIAAAILLAAYLRRSARSKALAESESRFRTLSEFTTAGILLYQADRIVYANQAAREITGYSEEEIRAIHFWELGPEAHREMVKPRGMARQRGEAVPSHYEFKILRKDATARWVDVTAGTVTYQGRPAGLITACDITKWKETEEALKQSEERVRMILDHVHEVIYYNALEGDPPKLVPKFVNSQVEEIFGYPPGHFLDGGFQTWMNSLHPDDRQRLSNLPPVVGSNAEHKTIVYRFRNGLTGDYHWIEDTAVPRMDKDGRVVGFFGVARYISRRKEAEAALRKSERDYRGLFECAHDAILVITGDLECVLDANAQACALYGYPHEELVGAPLGLLGMDPDECHKHLEPVRQNGFARDCQMKHRRRDGSALLVEINAAAVEYRGKPAILNIIRDVTEKRRAEEQIIRRNRQLQALLFSSQAMAGFMDLSVTLRAICKAAVEAFDLRMAWVGKVVPESTELHFVVSAGFDEGYAGQIRARWDESPQAQGPTGRCMRTRRPVVAHTSDAAFSPWRERAEARGYDAVCALPLLHEDTVRGAITVYSANPNAFDPETIEVLAIFARQCTMALVNAGLYAEAKRSIEELLRSGQQADAANKDNQPHRAPPPPGSAGEKA